MKVIVKDGQDSKKKKRTDYSGEHGRVYDEPRRVIIITIDNRAANAFESFKTDEVGTHACKIR